MTYHLVIWCEGGQGCPALFLGPPADALGRSRERQQLVTRALTAGWHRTWDARGQEHWHCPDCRAGGLAAPLPPASIPADCPF